MIYKKCGIWFCFGKTHHDDESVYGLYKTNRWRRILEYLDDLYPEPPDPNGWPKCVRVFADPVWVIEERTKEK